MAVCICRMHHMEWGWGRRFFVSSRGGRHYFVLVFILQTKCAFRVAEIYHSILPNMRVTLCHDMEMISKYS